MAWNAVLTVTPNVLWITNLEFLLNPRVMGTTLNANIGEQLSI